MPWSRTKNVTRRLRRASTAGGTASRKFKLLDYRADLAVPLTITLNGEQFELCQPVTVSALLAQLEIDARRVAVEHNLVVLKRDTFDRVIVQEGDAVEIVNFVGGG